MNPLTEILNCIISNPVGSIAVFGVMYLVIRLQYDREFRCSARWFLHNINREIDWKIEKFDRKIILSIKKYPQKWKMVAIVILSGIIAYFSWELILSSSSLPLKISDIVIIGVYCFLLYATVKNSRMTKMEETV